MDRRALGLPVRKAIGNAVRALRYRLGLNAEKFGAEVGLTEQGLFRIELGINAAGPGVLVKLRAMGLDLNHTLDNAERIANEDRPQKPPVPKKKRIRSRRKTPAAPPPEPKPSLPTPVLPRARGRARLATLEP